MDYKKFSTILDKLPEERTAAEQNALETCVAESSECAALAEAFQATLSWWQELPPLDPEDEVLTPLWRRIETEGTTRSTEMKSDPARQENHSDAVDMAKGVGDDIGQAQGALTPPLSGPGTAEGEASGLERGIGQRIAAGLLAAIGVFKRPNWWMTAVATTAGMLLFLRFGLMRPPPGPEPDFQVKGSESRLEPTVDLQAVIESGVDHSLRPADDLSALGPGDGLLFRFAVDGARFLALIERNPRHELSVLFQRSDLDPAGGAENIDLVDRRGDYLRYVPTAGAGEYTYICYVSTEPVFEGTAAGLDALWERYVNRYLEPLAGQPDDGADLDAVRVVVSLPGGVEAEAPDGDREAPPDEERRRN